MNPTFEESETIRAAVRRRYASIVTGAETFQDKNGGGGSCCAPTSAVSSQSNGACCGVDQQARTLGYTDADLTAVPEGANLGLGCGNPIALASLKPGQTVLDLGSGAGFDAFLAARAVGPTGRIIGVDMTPEMVAKARQNARSNGYTQVEFRLGEIEALPVADGTVDVIISNCVINLCPDKRPVYREAFRVLKAGGRLAVSDVVANGELSAEVKSNLALQTGCLAGATPRDELVALLKEAGFAEVRVKPKGNSDEIITSWEAKRGYEAQVFAAEVTATKPAAGCCSPSFSG